MVNIIPARPPETNSLTPTTEWMYTARDVLNECLADLPAPRGLRHEYSYFTKPIKYKDTEVLQLFFGNWTIHWQMSLHGEEEFDQEERYGDLTEQLLISLDVETGGRKVPRIGKLQRHILDSITPAAEEFLPAAEVKLVEHHLVWEAIEFNPYDDRSIHHATERLAEYIKVLSVPTIEAAMEWAEKSGIEMQSMRSLLKAS